MAKADSTVTYKDIPGFPGYRVGNDGSVWSCWRNKGRGWGGGTTAVMSQWHWRALKLRRLKGGYLVVALRRNKMYSHRLVHRLVLESFVGPCPDGQECRHRDGCRANNILSNLVWGTRKENAVDRVVHGTQLMGESVHTSKLTEEQIRSIRSRYANRKATQVELALEHNITQSNVSEIIRRRTWKHVD